MKSKVISINRSFAIKGVIILLFCVYSLVIVDFTLINDNFGRSISNIFLADKSQVNEYLSQKINLVPFATVKLFLNAYKNSKLEIYIVAENIVGNFLAFMPFAFFVPIVFKKVNSAPKFLAVISIGIILIEVLQLMFLTGSADIDDLILNVSGAMLIYIIFSIPKLKHAINKFVSGEANEN